MNLFQKKILIADTLGLGNPASDQFGYSTSFDSQGNILAIGAYFADTNSVVAAGAVYIITGSGSTWNQVARITGNTLGVSNPASDNFGASVAFNSIGNTLAVGANHSPGAAYIFTGSGSNWAQVIRLTGEPGPSRHYGQSVSFNSPGTVLAVGAEGGHSSVTTGATHIYTGSGNNWGYAAKITGNTLGLGDPSNDLFGWVVSFNSDGNLLAVGAPEADTNSISGAGAVYIYTGTGASWNQTARLTGNPSGIGDILSGNFGYSVSFNSSGNILAVGAIYQTTYTGIDPYNLSSLRKPNEHLEIGAVYVFTGQNSNWIQTARITGNIIGSSFELERNSFGNSIDLNDNGNILIVGAFTQDIATKLACGAFYIFSGQGGGNWVQTAIRSGTHSLESEGDNFGYSVSTNSIGNVFAIGADNTEIDENDLNTEIIQHTDLLTESVSASAGACFIFSEKNNQTITFPAIPTKTFEDPVFLLNQQTNVGLEISYQSSNTNVATVLGNSIAIVGAGSSTITASQAGDIDYHPANSINQILTVNKANQTITFNALPIKTFGDLPFLLTGISSAGLPISYTSSNTSVAVINDKTITITGVGASTITASQAGNSNYNLASSVNQTLTVIKSNQEINFPEIEIKYLGDSPFNPGATSSSNLPVSYISNNLSIAEIRGNFVYINNTGICFISGIQTGNINYNSAPIISKLLNVQIFPEETIIPSSLSSRPLLLNSNNYRISITGDIAASKEFNLLDDEKMELGFDKEKNYSLVLKDLEKNFTLYKVNNDYAQSANSYINFSNLNIDFTENIPQRTVINKSDENSTAYITYRLDNVNNDKLKSFNIDFKNIVTGLIIDTNLIPSLTFLPYTGEAKVCYPFTEFKSTEICTDTFICAICSEGKRIFLERGFNSYMDVPIRLLPFNTYAEFVDYDFSSRIPGRYRILLNSKFFSACCCAGEATADLCKENFQENLFESYCDLTNFIELKTFQRIKKNDLIISGERKSILDFLEESFNIAFLDRIYFPELERKYNTLYFSGQINNTKGFSEGDEIEIKQYYYPFEESFKSIFFKRPEYKEINKKFIYSIEITGENYFSNQTELINKINYVYNTGIYSWIPFAYEKEPYYDFGPMLSAEAINDNNLSLKSLKSGWLGRHLITLNISSRRKGTVVTNMVPQIMKLQGSNDLNNWVDIVSTQDSKSINENINNIISNISGIIPYNDDRVISEIELKNKTTVPIGTTFVP